MSSQRKVLVVDDDENIRAAFSDLLKREQCSMIAAASAEEAVAKLTRHHVDLVITDVRLKGQSGATLLLQVKAQWPDLPIIVITGYPNSISEHDAKVFGARFFFVKPLELSTMREAIRSCLGIPHG
jgi:two-component system response regulator FlrC